MFDQLTSLAAVQALVDSGHRESETVEYKTASRRLQERDHDELAKDLTAFANSAGGTLIYGVATDKNDKTKPVAVEPVDPSNVDIILQVASSHIRRPIAGLRWRTIEDATGAVTCLVIDVPASPDAPHQVAVRDYRYYRRHGARSEPMTHDLVELYFGRRLGPRLELRPVLSRVRGRLSYERHSGPWHLRLGVYNAGQRSARNALLLAYVPEPHVDVLTTPEGPHYLDTHDGPARKLGVSVDGRVLHAQLEAVLYSFSFSFDPQWLGRDLPLAFITLAADDMALVQLRMWLEKSAETEYVIQLEHDSRDPSLEVSHAPPP